MKVRHLFATLLLAIPLCGTAFAAGEEKKADDPHASVRTVVEKTLGKAAKILRIEDAGKSRVEGLTQVRVWMESPYGETPVLFYVTGDRQIILAGTFFDGEGKNLTRLDVGETKPRSIPAADMKVSDKYRIGSENAPVGIVFWTGADPYSKAIVERLFEIYEKNKDLMSLSFKFYPRTPADAAKMEFLTCAQGEQFAELYKKILALPSAWGSKEDIETFRADAGLKDKECDREAVRKDIELSLALNLPQDPRVFVNGTILLVEPTPESVGRIAGRDLK